MGHDRLRGDASSPIFRVLLASMNDNKRQLASVEGAHHEEWEQAKINGRGRRNEAMRL
jgi:hypothetical protein